ncbi:MAG: phosphoribosylformylglycinamidine synthase subunit PurL, partial [Trebonia sp.]
ARVLPGVVSGISFYGNCLGLPNIGGELAFDACYAGNPLVNALCVGILRHDELQEAVAKGAGNKVVLFGSRTGPDGVGGASVLASASFGGAEEGSGASDDGGKSAKRPSVQVGDPFMEKILIECCLELFKAGLIEGIQDLGAAGVACATTELSAGGDGGMRITLDDVPLRDPSLDPAGILMSESQERMMAVVRPDNLDAFGKTCAKWDVEAIVIGEVTDDETLTMTWRGGTVVEIPPRTAADPPVCNRPLARPRGLDELRVNTPDGLARPRSGAELKETLLTLLGSPELADKSWVTQQYDHIVRGNTVLAMPEDGGLLRVDESTGLGIALATDGNGRYCLLDPYQGTRLALGEAYRNVAMTGARPVAVTNCLNFGSPEDPEVMWQLAESVRGLAEGCAELGIPVTGGNVSLYNQTGASAIYPTPVIGVLGVHDDVRRRVGAGFGTGGARVVLLGTTRPEFGGSAWAHVRHGHLGGLPPVPDLSAERSLASLIEAAAAAGLLASAHDLSDGGLAIALAESCLRGGRGVTVRVRDDVFAELFSESAARAVISVTPGREAEFAALADSHGVPARTLGTTTTSLTTTSTTTTTGGGAFVVEDLFEVPLDELRAAWTTPLPALFG